MLKRCSCLCWRCAEGHLAIGQWSGWASFNAVIHAPVNHWDVYRTRKYSEKVYRYGVTKNPLLYIIRRRGRDIDIRLQRNKRLFIFNLFVRYLPIQKRWWKCRRNDCRQKGNRSEIRFISVFLVYIDKALHEMIVEHNYLIVFLLESHLCTSVCISRHRSNRCLWP